MDTKIARISFRLKDLFTVVHNKDTSIRIFYNNKEIDYDDDNKMSEYKDYRVVDLGIGEENNEPCLDITLDKSTKLIYIPY